MFVGLIHLRYLNLEQIQRGWLADRPVESVRCRLSRLQAAGVLRRVPITFKDSGWQLTTGGVQLLERVRDGAFDLSDSVKPTFLPHLLATNEVFLALANGEWVWERLPFEWLGSHRAVLRFTSYDGGRVAQRSIRPDGLVAPLRGAAGPRCFIELDCSTEAVNERPGRTSIVGKLKAYRSYLSLPQLGANATPYEVAFPDHRPVRVVFVLTSKDPLARRARSILESARQVAPGLEVVCVPVGDRGALREAILGGCGRPSEVAVTATAAPPPEPVISGTGIRKLTDFYRGAVDAINRAALPASDRDKLVPLVNNARDVLKRLNVGV